MYECCHLSVCWMQYATGEAVIESSLLVIGRSAIRLAVETRDQEPCLLLQKGEGGSVLRIHYRRISVLDVSYHILSMWAPFRWCERRFIQISFYAKNNTRIKITVQFSKKEGAPVAEALYRVFSSLYPHPSGLFLCVCSWNRVFAREQDGDGHRV